MNGQVQRVGISATKSSWRPVTNVVSQGSILHPVLLNTLIEDLDCGAPCTLREFTDDRKLGEGSDMPESHAAIQTHLVK